MLWQTMSSIGHTSTGFLLLSVCRFVEFDTSVICHVFKSLLWLFSIASYVFKSPNICFQGTKYEMNRDVIHLHSVVYLHWRCFYNDMGLIPKFRNGKRCWRKLEKQIPDSNQKWPATCVSHVGRLFDFQDIHWPLAFPGHVHWYILYGVNEITVLHEHKHYFDSVIRQIDKV